MQTLLNDEGVEVAAEGYPESARRLEVRFPRLLREIAKLHREGADYATAATLITERHPELDHRERTLLMICSRFGNAIE